MHKKMIAIFSIVLICGIGAWAIINNNGSKINNTPTDKNNSKNDCTILTARALHEKMFFNLTDPTNAKPDDEMTNANISLDKPILYLLYPEFEEEDCIIIHDKISLIQYYPDDQYTTVCFSWYQDQYTKTHVYYHFEGNITDTYKEGDTVEITLHLKHIELETTNMSYSLDVFEEQWESEQYFVENVQYILIDNGLKHMDLDTITKV